MKKIILSVILILTSIQADVRAKPTPRAFKSSSPTYTRTYSTPRSYSRSSSYNYYQNRIRELKREKNNYKKKWDYEARRNSKLKRQLDWYKKNYKQTSKIRNKYKNQTNREWQNKSQEKRIAKYKLKEQMKSNQIKKIDKIKIKKIKKILNKQMLKNNKKTIHTQWEWKYINNKKTKVTIQMQYKNKEYITKIYHNGKLMKKEVSF